MKRNFVFVVIVVALLSMGVVSAQGNPLVYFVWDAHTGEPIAQLSSDLAIGDARLNEDGSHIIAALNGGILRVIATETGEIVSERHLPVESDRYSFPSFVDVPDPASHVLVIRLYEQFYVWDWEHDAILYQGDSPYREVVPNYTGSAVLTMREDPPSVVIYSKFDPQNPLTVSLPDAPLLARWNHRGTLIGIADYQGFRLIDAANGATRYEFSDERLGDAYTDVVWSPDDRQIAIQATHSLHYEESSVIVIDAEFMRQTVEIPANVGIFSTEWDVNGTRILIAAYEGAGVRIFNAATGELTEQYGNLSDEYLSAGWSGDNTRILTEAYDNGDLISVWDTESGSNLLEMLYPLGVNNLIWNRDRNAVILRRYPEMTATVIDLSSENPEDTLITFQHPDTDLLGAAWSGDSTHILTWTGQERG